MNNKSKFLKFLLVFILILIIGVRSGNISTHFSHVDDLIAPNIELRLTSEQVIEKIEKKIDINKNTVENIFPILKPIFVALNIARSSTYAPSQFLFTSIFLKNNDNYKETLIKSRLISFLFSILSFIMLIYILKLLFKSNYIKLSIPALLIMGLSWEFIIYSVQSESYAVGVFSVLATFVIFIKMLNIKNISKNKFKFLTIILSVLIFFNYQIIFFIPGIFIVILILYEYNLKLLLKDTWQSISIFFLSFSALYFFFLKGLVNRGLNWNVGPNKEFMFALNDGMPLLEIITYTMKFFIVNGYITFRSLISIATENSFVNDIISVLFISFSIIGFIFFWKSNNYIKKYFAYYSLITLLIVAILIVSQKITLSPTRHSLILLPFIVIYTVSGLYYISVAFKLKHNLHLFLSLVLVFMFAFHYNNIKEERVDKFSEVYIIDKIKQYDIQSIYSYGWTWNLSFMNYIKENYTKSHNSSNVSYLLKNNKDYDVYNVMFISHRNIPLNDEIIENFIEGYKTIYEMKIIYLEEKISNIEIDFSTKTKNGTNSLMLYILEVRKKL